MWRSRRRCVIKPAYSVSFLLSNKYLCMAKCSLLSERPSYVFPYFDYFAFRYFLFIVSPSVHSCLFSILYNFTDHCHLVETQLQSIHTISFHKAASCLEIITLYFLRNTPLDHFLGPSVFNTKPISHTDSHATQTEGEAYNSVPVYLLITPVSLATSIGTARITFCQREVM